MLSQHPPVLEQNYKKAIFENSVSSYPNNDWTHEDWDDTNRRLLVELFIVDAIRFFWLRPSVSD